MFLHESRECVRDVNLGVNAGCHTARVLHRLYRHLSLNTVLDDTGDHGNEQDRVSRSRAHPSWCVVQEYTDHH
jgi:hypothetical protein